MKKRSRRPKEEKSSHVTTVGAAAHESAPVTLIYRGRLPTLKGKTVHPMARYRLKQSAMRAFGVLPTMLYPTTHAHVEIARVLGPGQRIMDEHDNLRTMLSGLVDALKPCYIVDDSPRWATFLYEQDSTRRSQGPFIEVRILYESHPNVRR